MVREKQSGKEERLMKRKCAVWFVIVFMTASLLGVLGTGPQKRIRANVNGVEYSYYIENEGIFDLRIDQINLSSGRIPVRVEGDVAHYTVQIPGVFRNGDENFMVASIGKGFFEDSVVTGSAIVTRAAISNPGATPIVNNPAPSKTAEVVTKSGIVSGSEVTTGASIATGGNIIASDFEKIVYDHYAIAFDFSDTSLQEVPAYAFAGEKTISGKYSGLSKVDRICGLDAVKEVGNYAFYGCRGVSELSLAACRSVGSHSFEEMCRLESVSIENVEEIGARAFCGSDVRSFVGNKLRVLGDEAFAGCVSLQYFEADCLKQMGEKAFSDSSALLTVKADSLPKLGAESFLRCTDLTELSLEGLESVASGAFYGCAQLQKFDGKDVKTVGDNAFNSCDSLTYVSLPKVETVGNYSFFRCGKLTDFRADLLTEVCTGAFQECRGLESFQAKSLTAVGNYAFYQSGVNTVAKKIFRVGRLNRVGKGAFGNCSCLTYLSTEYLQEIGASAFAGSGLKKCYLYADNVSADAFEGATHLTLFSMNPNTDFVTMADGSAMGKKAAAGYLYGIKVVGYKRCSIGDLLEGYENFTDFVTYRRKTGDGSYLPKNSDSYKVIFTCPSAPYGASYVVDQTKDGLTLQRRGYAYVPCEYAELAEKPLKMRSIPELLEDKGSHYRFLGYYFNDRKIVDQDGCFNSLESSELSVEKDNVLTAAFKAATYSITYQEGWFKAGVEKRETYTYGEEVSLPDGADLSHTGYRFEGWKKKDSKDILACIPKGMEGDIVLVGQWSPGKYTVTYDGNGGRDGEKCTVSDERTFSENYLLRSTCPFIRTGYVFDGWVDDKNVPVESVGSNTAKDITLYASWSPKEYKIRYSYEKGVTLPDAPEKYTIESGTFNLPIPERTGYVFDGWKKSDGTLVDIVKKGSTGDLLLTALWSTGKYKITYHWNGGSAENYRKNYEYGRGGILPKPQREHYVFNGWYQEEDFSGKECKEISSSDSGDKEFYADWSPVSYTITFDPGDDGVCSVETMSYTVETDVDISIIPERTGYVFNGWYQGTDKVDHIGPGMSGDITLSASWTLQKKAVTYILNGGDIQDKEYTTEHIYGEKEKLPESVVKKGYVFDGWYQESNFSGEKCLEISAEDSICTFYAKWSPEIYTYRYHYTDGAGKACVIDKTVFYGGVVPYPDVDLGDCRLEKWVDEKSEKVLEQGDYVVTVGDRDFIAVMRSIHTYLIFDARGGKCSETQKEVYTGKKAGALPSPEKKGYEFTGWVAADGTRYSSETVINLKPGSGLILYATYKQYYSERDDITNDVEQTDPPAEGEEKAICIDTAELVQDTDVKSWYVAPAKGVYYDLLTEEEQRIYAGLYNYYKNGRHMGDAFNCVTHYKVDVPQIQNALQAFMFDHKEISWIGGAQFSISRNNEETKLQFCITSGYDYELVVKSYSAVTASKEYERLLSTTGVRLEDSTAEKIRKIADTVADYITYTTDVGTDGKYSSKYRDAAYVVFVNENHEAVCVGYAVLFQQICHYYGIDCVVVSGSTSTGGHAWNYVKIGDQWYGVDTTWYDSDRSGSYILAGTKNFNDYERKYNTPILGKDLAEVMNLAEEDYVETKQGSETELPVSRSDIIKTPVPEISLSPAPMSSGTDKEKTDTAEAIEKDRESGGVAVISGKEKMDSVMERDFVYVVKGNVVTIRGLTAAGAKKRVLTVPDTLAKGYFVRIKKNAFRNAQMHSMVLGDGVKQIDKKAFTGCKHLQNVTVKSCILSKVGKRPLSTRVTVRVPKGKKKIYKKWFIGCRIIVKNK